MDLSQLEGRMYGPDPGPGNWFDGHGRSRAWVILFDWGAADCWKLGNDL